jgi:hypothetical protein
MQSGHKKLKVQRIFPPTPAERILFNAADSNAKARAVIRASSQGSSRSATALFRRVDERNARVDYFLKRPSAVPLKRKRPSRSPKNPKK